MSDAIFTGDINGAANFDGDGTVVFQSGYRPGDSTASVAFGGGVTFENSATLSIEIAGTTPDSEHDQLIINDTATLGGTLDLILAGFVPDYGDSFQIVTYASHWDEFDTVTGAFVNANMTLATIFSSTDLALVAALPGDGDLNGIVNFVDFVLLSNNFGQSDSGWGEGNFNLDGVTNFADFVTLSNNFGAMVPSDGSYEVPEPVTAANLSLACAALLKKRKISPTLWHLSSTMASHPPRISAPTPQSGGACR